MRVAGLLAAEQAAELADLLRSKRVRCELRTKAEEGGVQSTEVLVEDHDYEQACEIAEQWVTAYNAAVHQKMRIRGPKCGSFDWGPALKALPVVLGKSMHVLPKSRDEWIALSLLPFRLLREFLVIFHWLV